MRFKPNELCKILEDFHDSDREVLRISLTIPDQYSSTNSAQGTWRGAIRYCKFSMKTFVKKNTLYIVKLEPDYRQTSLPKLCSNCQYSLEDLAYNPDSDLCKTCVAASNWEEMNV